MGGGGLRAAGQRAWGLSLRGGNCSGSVGGGEPAHVVNTLEVTGLLALREVTGQLSVLEHTQ